MRWRGATVAAAIAAVSAGAAAGDVDPSRVTRLSVGAPRALHPMSRVDAGRTGRVAALPEALEAEGKTVVSGGLDLSIAVTETGDLIAATTGGELVRVDASGKEVWRARLPSPSVHAPVLTAHGDAVVVTDGGECLAFDARGRLRFRVALPGRGRDVKATPLALRSGGVAIAVGRTLLLLDDGGHVVGRARAPEAAIGDLLADDAGLVITTDSGRVMRWRSPDPPVLVGWLGGSLSAPAALAQGILAAVVDGSRLVLFDLASGVARASVQASTLLDGPPSMAGGRVWIAGGGALIAFAMDGREIERILPPKVSTSMLTAASAPPAMLVTDGGAVAFARADGEVGVASAGVPHVAEMRACDGPLGLVSGGLQVLVVCHDGTVVRYGGRAP